MPAPDQIASSPGQNRRRIAFGVCLEVVALLAILAMLNYLAVRHFRRFDLASNAGHELSPLTLQTLRSLTNQVKVTVLLDRHDPSSLFAPVSALLREYALKNSKLRVEYVDYLRDPTRAQIIKVKHHLPDSRDKDLIIFESQGHHRVVYENELSEYDWSGVLTAKTKEVKRTHFKGELFFTSALLNVLDPRPHKAYFLQGHREHKPLEETHEEGYGKFAALLAGKGILVEPLVLQGPSEIPADCEVLIIAGPHDPLPDAELRKIDKFLREGGRLFLLFGYFSARSGLENLVAQWGIEAGYNVVRDLKHTQTRWDVVTDRFADHPIVKPIYDAQIHLNLPRAIEKRPGFRSESSKLQELVFTSKDGEVLTDIRDGMPYPNPKDRRGAISLGVAVEKGRLEGVGVERGSTRMIVMGDSIFLGNQGIESAANRDFASLAVNWLLDRPWLLEISPRPIQEYRLSLTRAQMTALRWILLAAFPATGVLLGGLVWMRRRF